jgi:hypothetical protein
VKSETKGPLADSIFGSCLLGSARCGARHKTHSSNR